MSGAAMLTLLERPSAALRWLAGPAEDGPEATHALLSAEIARLVSPAHAAVLARPVVAPGLLSWQAPGLRARSFASLGAAERQALGQALGAILSDIRRAAESGLSPALAAAWPALREVPDLDCVFAVDGRPVLAAWGHAGAAGQPGRGASGLLARFDDGLPFAAPPRTAWRPWLLGAGALAAMGLAAGLLLPLLGARLAGLPEAAQCRIAPESLALFEQAQRAADRGEALQAELARLEEAAGRRRLDCPLPEPPPRQAAPARASATPPPLPQDRWDRGDLGLLEGCWQSTAEMNTRDVPSGRLNAVRSWRFCFDAAGSGQQTLDWTDNRRCEGPIRASFAEGVLRLQEARTCAGPERWMYLGDWECRRLDENEADCVRTQRDGPGAGNRQTGRFRR